MYKRIENFTDNIFNDIPDLTNSLSLNSQYITGILQPSFGGTGASALSSQFDISNNTLYVKDNIISPWNKDSNLFYNDNNLGIGKSNPTSKLDVAGNVTATNFTGSGSGITALNATNITTGTLPVSRGGIGTTTLTSSQLLIGNGELSPLQSANLSWNNTSSTLSTTNFAGSGSGITALNATNITTGTLPVSRGGIGTTTLTSSQLLIGNGELSPLQSANLSWNNTSSTLSATNFAGSGSGITALNATNITTGTLPVSRGGTGVTALSSQFDISNNTLFVKDNTISPWNKDSNLFYSGNNLGIGKSNPVSKLDVAGDVTATNFVGSGASLTALNASNITTGILPITRGGTGVTAFSSQFDISNNTLFVKDNSVSPWNKDSNLFYINNNLGIGKSNPTSKLDVVGDVTATNFVGSGAGITALNATNITTGTLPMSRGGIGTTTLTASQLLIGNGSSAPLQSANLSWNNTSNTLSATNFVGSGAGITGINATNITTGTLPMSRGGIGTTTLTASQLLIGNGSSAPLQSANLSWNNTSNTLSATNFVGSGAGITGINATNITTGILPITRGGTGVTAFSSQFDISNNTLFVKDNTVSPWNKDSNLFYINNNLGIGKSNPTSKLDVVGDVTATNFIGSGASLTALNATNITTGTLPMSRGGIGTTTLTASQLLIGNNSSTPLQSANLSWNNTSNTLSATNFIGSGAGITNINASNITTGTLPMSRGGIGTTTLTASQLLIGNGSSTPLQSANLSWNNTSNTLSATNISSTTKFCINSNCFNESNILDLNAIINYFKTNLTAPPLAGLRASVAAPPKGKNTPPNIVVLVGNNTIPDMGVNIMISASTDTVDVKFRIGIRSLTITNYKVYHPTTITAKTSKPEIRIYFTKSYQNPFGTTIILERLVGTTWKEVSNKNMILADTYLIFLNSEVGP
jgi:fibronectin-binding autotransporter adhesin